MKNIFRRAIAIFIILVLTVSVIPVVFASGNVTVSYLKEKYPEGKYWNGGDPETYTDTPCTHHGNCSKYGYTGWCGCNSYNGKAIQCHGFAYQLAFLVYGGDPYTQWSADYSESALDTLKAGDIVRYKNNGHTIFITAVNDSYITYADCNNDGHCGIRWNRTVTKSTLKSTFTYVKKAPYEWGASALCECSVSYAGEYICTTSSYPLTIRSGHSTSHSSIGSIPPGATVIVSEADGEWAHIIYNGIYGYASMEYLSLSVPYQTYNVEFDANGGISAPSPQVKIQGNELELSGVTPIKPYLLSFDTGTDKLIHSVFKGWNTSPDGSGEYYDAGGKYVTDADVVLYAIWENAVAGELPVPVKDEYTFDGWYTSDGTLITAESVITENMTLYAKWEKHVFGEYVSDNNATTEADGTKTRVCTVCGEKETVTDIGTRLVKVFSDVPDKMWYKEYVDYSVLNDIFNGTSDTEFSPDMVMTRAQFVQVLANVSGIDTKDTNVTTDFSDVPSGKWFTPAVKWAFDNGIVNGTGDGEFSPDNSITREDMCLMLVRYATYRELDLKATKEKAVFADDSEIGFWAVDAVYICQMAEIVSGKEHNFFDPKATGSRAEAATIFTRFHKNYIA